jgi:hypothetical protein
MYGGPSLNSGESKVRSYEGTVEAMSALRDEAIPTLENAISFLEWTKHFHDLLRDNLSSQYILLACLYELVLAKMHMAVSRMSQSGSNYNLTRCRNPENYI